jgi:6-phosphogluconolactonase (cycloisomerase 2 family)
MRTRFAWIAVVLALVSLGFVMSCSTKYSSSSNGLVVVPSRDSKVMQTFSLNLSNGHVSQINNASGPTTPGLPSSVVLDPAGAFVYLLVTLDPTLAAGPGNLTGIATFQVASDGKLTAGTTKALSNTILTIGSTCESIPVTPVALAMDSAGKFLFVANSATADAIGNPVPGSVSVLAIGSNAALAEVSPVSCTSPNTPGSPFPLPVQTGGSTPSASALALTPTVFPAHFAPCSGQTAPATQNLYVADSVDNVLVNYLVTSTGSLTLVPTVAVPTGTLPSGVAVDPCNRFVYVANTNSNNVSAFTICSVVSPSCLQADYSLQLVAGSPYSVGDHPGPIAVDAFANFLYVVDTGSSQISAFRIGSASGSLTPLSTVATNSGPNSIAIRSDDSWLFVANSNSANVSEYAITPAAGTLTPVSPFTTLSYPSGVAVK